MHDSHGHDHSQMTHSAKCDEPACNYVAQTHAHDDETAAMVLSEDLARHNSAEHDKKTKADEILEEVKSKLQRISQ